MKTEAGNCVASGLTILCLPDVYASSVDTWREREQEDAFSLFPPADKRCQMTRMNGERKESRSCS